MLDHKLYSGPIGYDYECEHTDNFSYYILLSFDILKSGWTNIAFPWLIFLFNIPPRYMFLFSVLTIHVLSLIYHLPVHSNIIYLFYII